MKPFTQLTRAVSDKFHHYDGHIFIMATGIVVRSIAPHLIHKTADPAVVVLDESGNFAISLVSGHLGGANALAQQVAQILNGQAVITTATDLSQVPAIDLVAKDRGLKIENPDAIKAVSMAILTGTPLAIYDPFGQMREIPWPHPPQIIPSRNSEDQVADAYLHADAGIYVDDKVVSTLPKKVLILRPPTLTVGMGCNRNTPTKELRALLESVLQKFNLAPGSIGMLASVDLKANEPGLLNLARHLNLEITFYTTNQLKQIDQVPTPSDLVKNHIGVHSVCEAAAILSAPRGDLIVTKQKSPNVTVAIARRDFTSSVSDPAAASISPTGP